MARAFLALEKTAETTDEIIRFMEQFAGTAMFNSDENPNQIIFAGDCFSQLTLEELRTCIEVNFSQKPELHFVEI